MRLLGSTIVTALLVAYSVAQQPTEADKKFILDRALKAVVDPKCETSLFINSLETVSLSREFAGPAIAKAIINKRDTDLHETTVLYILTPRFYAPKGLNRGVPPPAYFDEIMPDIANSFERIKGKRTGRDETYFTFFMEMGTRAKIVEPSLKEIVDGPNLKYATQVLPGWRKVAGKK